MSKEQGKLNPLFIIVVAVIILTLFVRYSFEDSTLLSAGSLSYPTVKTYMGIFFIVFSLLKLCDLDKFAEMFKSSQGEIWVNAKDRLPTRLTLLSYVNSSDYGQGNLSLDLRYRNFNMPVDFSEPADFRPLDEILQMIKGSLSDSSLLNNFLKPAN